MATHEFEWIYSILSNIFKFRRNNLKLKFYRSITKLLKHIFHIWNLIEFLEGQ